MQYITSAEQDHIFTTLSQSSGGVKVKYLDRSVALNTLILQLVSDLKEGKSINIVTASSDTLFALNRLLSEVGLSEYAVIADSYEPVAELTISQLRTNNKARVNKAKKYASRHAFAFMDTDIRSAYQNLTANIRSDIKVRDLPQILQSRKTSKTISDLDLSDVWSRLKEAEFYTMLDKIAHLASLYLPIYSELEMSEVFEKEILQTLSDQPTIDKLTSTLEKRIEQLSFVASGLRNILKNYKAEYELKNQKQNTLATQAIKQAIIDIASGVLDKEAKPSGFNLLKKAPKVNKIAERISAINEMLLKENESWKPNQKDAEAIEDGQETEYLYALLEAANSTQNTSSSFHQVSKHISLLNQNNEQWHALSQQLDDFLANLHGEHIFNEKFENNSKSIIQQLALIDKVQKILSRALGRLEHHGNYYIFLAKVSKDTDARRIVTSLQNTHTSSWTEVVKSSYIDYHLQKATASDLPKETNLLDEMSKLKRDIFDQDVELIKHRLAQDQKALLTTIKSSDKLLFQSLVKKKLPMSSTAAEMATAFPDYTKGLFPILISASPSVVNCDVSYCMDANVEIENATISFSEFTQEDFSDMSAEKDYLPLYLNNYNYTKDLNNLTSTEKIKAAKKLAKLLLANNQNIKIYQAKEASIISMLPFYDDQNLEAQLADKSVKVMQLDDLYLRLVESLLVIGRDRYLIIKDGLLAAHRFDTYLWQHDVIEKAKAAGIKVRSIYTAALLDNQDPTAEVITEIFKSKTTTEVMTVDTETEVVEKTVEQEV